jgi:hypothetical protein
MEQPKPGLRKRDVGHTENGQKDALHAKILSEKDSGSHSSHTEDAKEQTVWGKPSGGEGQ